MEDPLDRKMQRMYIKSYGFYESNFFLLKLYLALYQWLLPDELSTGSGQINILKYKKIEKVKNDFDSFYN